MPNSLESMSLQEVRENLSDLIRLVAQRKMRVEVGDGHNEPCLLISKSEVEALEQALRILGDTDQVTALSNSFKALAEATNQPAMA